MLQLKSQLNFERYKNNVLLQIGEISENNYQIKSAFSGQRFDILTKEGDQIYAKFEVQKIEYNISKTL